MGLGGPRVGIERLGQTEVKHLDPTVGRKLDVCRLQVTVDHTLLVRGLECLRDLLCDFEHLVGIERAASDALRQVLARDQLHGNEARIVDRLQAVDLGDVRVVQRGQQLGFALEAGEPLGIGGERLGQHLDRHLAVERGVHGAPDHAHAALADLLDEAVVVQTGTRFDRQAHLPTTLGIVTHPTEARFGMIKNKEPARTWGGAMRLSPG